MSVDWTKPIEAVEKATGRVVPMEFWKKDDQTSMYLTKDSPSGRSNIYSTKDGRDNCSHEEWFIRNTVTATPTPAIDWTKPLELEDGTPVVVFSGPDGDGDYRLARADGENFTEEQTGRSWAYAHWHEDGSRLYGLAGLRVRNVQPAAAHQQYINWLAGTVTGPAVPQGFAEVMKHTVVGADITGILISAPDTMSITTPNGTYEFRITSAQFK